MKDLATLRELSGLTQFSAARRAGLSRMRLSLAENGEITLTGAEEATLRRVLLKAIQDKNEQILAVLSQTGAAQVGA